MRQYVIGPFVLFGLMCGLMQNASASIKPYLTYDNTKGNYNLTIPASKIHDEETYEIVDYIKQNKLGSLVITNGILDYCDVGDFHENERYRLILNALVGNKSLTVLSMENNELGVEGALFLSSILRNNETLISINIANNNIGDEGFGAIANSIMHHKSLRSVNIGLNNLRSHGIRHVVNLIYFNAHITTLILSGNQIGDQGVIDIASALNKNTTLTTLGLRDNYISRIGARALGGVLRCNQSIEMLDLELNNLRDEGVEELVNGLRGNTSLTTLNLNGNRITNNGTHIISDLLKVNNRMERLYIDYNNATLDSSLTLLEILVNNNLTLVDLAIHGDDGLLNAILRRNKLLVQLSSHLSLYTLTECKELHRLSGDVINSVLSDYFFDTNNLGYYLHIIMDGTIGQRFTSLTEDDKELITNIIEQQMLIIRRIRQLNLPIRCEDYIYKNNCNENSNTQN